MTQMWSGSGLLCPCHGSVDFFCFDVFQDEQSAVFRKMIFFAVPMFEFCLIALNSSVRLQSTLNMSGVFHRAEQRAGSHDVTE